MAHAQLVLYEPELRQIHVVCEKLHGSCQARAVVLVDRNGQFIASFGDVAALDTTSLASLTAGNMAATQGLAKLLGEQEFPSVFHEGKFESLHLSVVNSQAILAIVFGRSTTLGLVRLRAKKACEALAELFDTVAAKAASGNRAAPLGEITDADIDSLFGH